MLRIAELLWGALWRLLPLNSRQVISNRILLARSRARIPIPLSEAVVFTKDKSHRERFKNFLGPDSTLPREELLPSLPDYSLLITIRDEEESIRALLDSVLAQSAQPNEVIICDGGSKDQTLSVISAWQKENSAPGWKLEVFEEVGASIARGRNLAARRANTELFLFTDAGAELTRDWAENLLLPFYQLPETEVAMGWYQPICRSKLQTAVAEFIVPNIDAIDPRSFLPSARSLALRAEGFFAVGGYPEHLSKAGEDSLFDYYLKTVVKKVAFCPDAISKWRMPSTLSILAKTIRGYSRGDAEGGVIAWGYYLHLLEKLSAPLIEFLLAFLLCVIAALFHSSLLLALAVVVFLNGFYRLFQVVSGYGLKSEKLGFGWRLLAIGLLISNQAIGFVQGYLGRPEIERRRIRVAEKGHVLVFLPSPFVFSSGSEETKRITELLRDSWYVSAVASDAPEMKSLALFAHPQYESHIRSQFRLEHWFEKHKPWLTSKGREFTYLDFSQDALSAELIALVEAHGGRAHGHLGEASRRG